MKHKESNLKNVLYFTLFTWIAVIGIMMFPESADPKPGPKVIILSSKNTISLNSPITAETATTIQTELMEKSHNLGPNKDLYLTLNSPGGNIVDGERIIETALGLPNQVNTISLFSASMSFIISQYLDKRYILDTGVMMSHRAYAGGIEGQVPGNFITRSLDLLNEVTKIDRVIAKRNGVTVETYQRFIRDEVWLRGGTAVTYNFADEVVRIQCDHSLSKPLPPKTIRGMFSDIIVTWHSCPLITQPLSVDFGNNTTEIKEKLRYMLYDKKEFIHKYGVPNMFEDK